MMTITRLALCFYIWGMKKPNWATHEHAINKGHLHFISVGNEGWMWMIWARVGVRDDKHRRKSRESVWPVSSDASQTITTSITIKTIFCLQAMTHWYKNTLIQFAKKCVLGVQRFESGHFLSLYFPVTPLSYLIKGGKIFKQQYI